MSQQSDTVALSNMILGGVNSLCNLAGSICSLLIGINENAMQSRRMDVAEQDQKCKLRVQETQLECEMDLAEGMFQLAGEKKAAELESALSNTVLNANITDNRDRYPFNRSSNT